MFPMIYSIFHRLRSRKIVLLVYIGMSIAAIAAGLYLSDQKVSFHIASYQVELPEVQGLTITKVDKPILKSDLVLQSYDAMIYEEDGKLQIESIKSAAQQQLLLAMLNSEIETGVAQNKGRMIFGYSMMFMMMQSLVYLMLFGNDKEQHMLARLQVTPLRKLTYLISHVGFAFIATCIPSFLCLIIVKMMGFAIGFTLLQFAVLLLSLAFVSVSFSFLMNTVIHSSDTANMITSACYVLTSALSGCFISFSSGGLLADIINMLPQKQLFTIADVFSEAVWTTDASFALIYVLGFGILCLIIAGIRCQRIFHL